ncbi:MAG: FAD-dependent oxidoreductase [bacterium]|nr:FAD-dependent oxidoreductase [bacterium]
MEYDLAIIGGGPAGTAAAVYAARKRLKTAIIAESFGGQSVVSFDIQNWIGTVSITGEELAKRFKEHIEAYASDVLDIKEGERVLGVDKLDSGFKIKTTGHEYTAKAALVTTGSHRRKLDVPGAAEFENKGITYCASCDGPLFSGQDVVVIGGGNAAFETVVQLAAYAKSVVILQRSAEYRADPITVEKVLANPKVKAYTNTEILEIKGDKFVSSIVFKKKETDEVIELPTKGIFVEIGLLPTTDFVSHLVKVNEYKQIITDPRTQRTSVEGIWAAGDCTDGLYHQNNIAAGDAVRALEDLYLDLHLKQ